MRKLNLKLIFCLAVLLLASCTSYKKVVYLQDVVPIKQQDIEQKYEVIIHNDDLLAIMSRIKLVVKVPVNNGSWGIWWILRGISIFRF